MDPRDAYHLGTVPLGVAIAGLFVIVMARSHATYWLGRGVVRGARALDEHEGVPRWWHSSVRRLEAWSRTPGAEHGLGDLLQDGGGRIQPWGGLGQAAQQVVHNEFLSRWRTCGSKMRSHR